MFSEYGVYGLLAYKKVLFDCGVIWLNVDGTSAKPICIIGINKKVLEDENYEDENK